jgi:NTE family protein
VIGQRNNSQSGPVTGLILSGGGARAAYQVGVLKAVADMLPRGSRNPFGVICGTSAGAINATALATHAWRFRAGVRGLEAVWRNFQAEHVYRTGVLHLSSNAARWLLALFFGGLGARRPVSLLDNGPLQELLRRVVRFERIQQGIDTGDLRALAITASGYTSGESVTFFQGREELNGWRRARRVGMPAEIGLEHLLASSAIPGMFPAVPLHREYFGDGSVRQLAPISPALHLGADRIMVVGVGERIGRPRRTAEGNIQPPSVAQMAGHLLDSAFLDTLEGDLERLERVNHTISLIPEKARRRSDLGLRRVEVLKIEPTESLSAIAAHYAGDLPASMRFFLRGSGATESAGSTIVSYLLFEQRFCRELINLGYADTLKRENEVLRFLGYDPSHIHGAATYPPQDVW